MCLFLIDFKSTAGTYILYKTALLYSKTYVLSFVAYDVHHVILFDSVLFMIQQKCSELTFLVQKIALYSFNFYCCILFPSHTYIVLLLSTYKCYKISFSHSSLFSYLFYYTNLICLLCNAQFYNSQHVC